MRKMNIIPIVFAFDENLILPAGVCITSLLMNAKPDTYYDIFVLHAKDCHLENTELVKIPNYFSNSRIQFRNVGDEFLNSFEIRGITIAAYYRLLIPRLISEYDKVIYADVDIIFQMDLAELYDTYIDEVYIAACYDLSMKFGVEGMKYIDSVKGLEQGNYIQSGFLLMNTLKIREDNLIARFLELTKQNYKFQDQDILNIACQRKKIELPIWYNLTDYSFYYLQNNSAMMKTSYTDLAVMDILKKGNLHYNGHKPWQKYCVNFDIWWEYYRKSPFFDEKYYFNFFYSKLDEYDLLPFWKRVKILLRYFKTRCYKINE